MIKRQMVCKDCGKVFFSIFNEEHCTDCKKSHKLDTKPACPSCHKKVDFLITESGVCVNCDRIQSENKRFRAMQEAEDLRRDKKGEIKEKLEHERLLRLRDLIKDQDYTSQAAERTADRLTLDYTKDYINPLKMKGATKMKITYRDKIKTTAYLGLLPNGTTFLRNNGQDMYMVVACAGKNITMNWDEVENATLVCNLTNGKIYPMVDQEVILYNTELIASRA